MNTRKYRYFSCDFETTVFEGQTYTEVWAAACVELFTEDVAIFNSIDDMFSFFKEMEGNQCLFFHNLKFDGAFILHYLMVTLGFEEAYEYYDYEKTIGEWIPEKNMKNNTFSYSISNMGQWYRISIKVKDKIIQIRDSLKLIPFSVKTIGNSFGTKHKKLDIEYKGFRYSGCKITEEEKEYISNDVLVVKEALEIMFENKHNKLTIGSCCLSEFKNLIGAKNYKRLFPNVYEIELNNGLMAGDWIKHTYRGAWVYLVKGKESIKFNKGFTADVNSLYPSVMHSESGNKYPVGEPTFWEGNYIPSEAKKDSNYFFIRIKTRFYLREGYLPFLQIKNNMMYKGTECLESSDVLNKKDGKYYDKFIDSKGRVQNTTVELYLTMTDYYRILEYYELVDFEIIDGCYFRTAIGIFDKYIDKYREIKMNSKGAKRTLAKLFLNNLYGKMASSKNSSYKKAYLKENNVIGFMTIIAEDKVPGYIPVGSAITSYARDFTIRAAQKNYYGADKPGFIYADTDSIHCNMDVKDVKGIKIDPINFCCWKIESTWDIGYFVRAKTYLEHIIEEDLAPVENPYYAITCAGMPDRCKELFIKSITGDIGDIEDYNEEQKRFLEKSRTVEDFDVGLSVPGKLLPKRIFGGIVLEDTTYKIR